MKIKYQPSQTEVKIKKKVYVNKLEHIVSSGDAHQLVDQGDADFPNGDVRFLRVPSGDRYLGFAFRDIPVCGYYKATVDVLGSEYDLNDSTKPTLEEQVVAQEEIYRLNHLGRPAGI